MTNHTFPIYKPCWFDEVTEFFFQLFFLPCERKKKKLNNLWVLLQRCEFLCLQNIWKIIDKLWHVSSFLLSNSSNNNKFVWPEGSKVWMTFSHPFSQTVFQAFIINSLAKSENVVSRAFYISVIFYSISPTSTRNTK